LVISDCGYWLSVIVDIGYQWLWILVISDCGYWLSVIVDIGYQWLWILVISDCGYWLSAIVVKRQVSNFSAISWRKQVTIDEMIMSTLYSTNMHSFRIFIVLAHCNNSLRLNMSFHSDTLSCFRTNQSLLLFLNAAWLAEKQQVHIL
jgi:hypothetical protein